MYLIRPPFLYRWLFSRALFRVPNEKDTVYLTFDDGPHPEATPFVLDVLKAHGIKATFFVLGKNALAYPELVARISEEGHTLGNHGMNHLNGWQTDVETYVADSLEAQQLLGTELYRPPYGRITWRQYRRISQEQKVVLWDVISGDFDGSITHKEVIDNVLKNVRGGSIVTMHDSSKAMNALKSSMNEIITLLKERGYALKPLLSTEQCV